ncbi:SDR family oxidoreductase [Ensifer adhaerens]|uniref:SDR family oxidoreductase n=1 Tax=Ensifer adhaerens TaxID=106592 RepID=UPI00098F3EDA|nr:SDR family oxidoreductase [Ensifer adhaerens]
MTSSTARRQTVLISGASRGLGAELARLYAEDGWRVIACVRGVPPHASAADRYPLDVANPASIDTLAETLQGTAIDVLINNAAVRGDTGGLATLEADDFLDVMRVNALAPLLVTRALLPSLRAGSNRVVANISSRAGSLAEGTLDDDDDDYAYRCSKAALNMATVKLAQDLKSDGISVVSLHPGWVQTDMGGSDAVVSVADSAAGLKAIIDKADLAASGSFRAYDGQRVSW